MSDKLRSREDIHKRIQTIQDELESLGVKSLSLFGSLSRNEVSRGSDLDFLVDFKHLYTFGRYIETKRLLEELFDCDVDLVTPDALRPEMKDNVKQNISIMLRDK